MTSDFFTFYFLLFTSVKPLSQKVLKFACLRLSAGQSCEGVFVLAFPRLPLRFHLFRPRDMKHFRYFVL